MSGLGGGEVSSRGLEAVLVGQVCDGVGDTVGADVGVLAADLEGLVLSSYVLELPLFFGGDAVGALVSRTYFILFGFQFNYIFLTAHYNSSTETITKL